jgi:hypothetical protein
MIDLISTHSFLNLPLDHTALLWALLAFTGGLLAGYVLGLVVGRSGA